MKTLIILNNHQRKARELRNAIQETLNARSDELATGDIAFLNDSVSKLAIIIEHLAVVKRGQNGK